jgi:alkylation response protein AidB-like acyl-CoA dehydrogenase
VNLSYSQEYEEFRAEVREFLRTNWTEEDRKSYKAPPVDTVAGAFGGGVPLDEHATAFRKKAIEKGYLYRRIPRKYGGGEQPPDPLKATIITEEFRRAKAPFEIMGQGPSMLAPTLIEKASEEQKQRFVEPTLLGQLQWCQGYSEPGAGSDLASLRTTAVLDGDHWVVNGQKIWTSNAQNADWMFALIRTEPDKPKHDGITYFLIDMKTEGLDVRPLRQMTGEADFNEVFFDNVRVPKDSIVGERGAGWQVSRATLKHERALIGSASMARRTFDGLVAMAQGIEVRGKKVIADPVIRDRITDLESRLLAAEYNGYRILTIDARGEEPGLAGMVTKLHTTSLVYDVTKLAMDILSDHGLCGPGEPSAPDMGMFSTAYMWYFGMALGGGAPNIQRNIIGERGLGLPRDRHK